MRHQKEMTFQLHYQNGDLENGAGLKSPAKSPNQEQGNDELAHELQKLGLGFLGNTFISLAALGLCCCTGLPPAAGTGGCSLAALCGPLTAAASLGAEHGLQATQPSVAAVPGLQITGSVVVAPGLSCSVAHGIFQNQGSKPCLLHWQAGSLPLSHQGSPYKSLF